MKISRVCRTALSVATLQAGLVFSAFGQLVTPPTAAPPKTPEYVPPPPAPAPVPGPGGINRDPRTVAKPKQEIPTDPYQSLVKRGTDGRVLPLSKPVHRAALEVNPLVLRDPEVQKKVAAALAERDAQIDRICVDSLDIVLKFDDGGLEKIKTDDAKEMVKQIRALTEPITPPGGEVSTAFLKSGALPDMAAKLNFMIVQDYNKAYFAERKEVTSSSRIYHQRVEETMIAYHKMLTEAANDLGKVTSTLNLPDDKRTALSGLSVAVQGTTDEKVKLDAMRAFMREMPVDVGRQVLKNVIANRAK